ncbi:unnamed protein product [Adineta ricciae]|uniref:non-specific serine/threonine protein kinase n=1 Tax=Adineta ricciae TaxID=249248 RepID=A0A815B5T4_ADIRI|nr:unnamed protein product [Adineta ricciae]
MSDVISSYYQWPRQSITKSTRPTDRISRSTRRTVPQFSKERSSRSTTRKITLYRNGDPYFSGKQISINPQNYSSMQLFFQQLSTIIDLPYGVRRLFTIQNGSEITNVNYLKDGASYVCASFEPFQKLSYTAITTPRIPLKSEHFRQPLNDIHSPNRVHVRPLPTNQFTKVGAIHGSISTTHANNRLLANNLFLQSFTSTAANPVQQQKKFHFKQNKYTPESSFNKPRSITIIKQGNEKVNKTITILLNRRTVQTFDQLLCDISEAFGYQKNRADKIKRLFNLRGRQVNGINDFFRDDDVFVAVTHNNDISSMDLHEISLKLFTDSQSSPMHRRRAKKTVQTSTDADTSIVEQKDEESLSPKDSAFMSTRATNNKQNEIVPEHPFTSNDSSPLKTKRTNKLPTISIIEQQRERERQRLREEEELRRKRILSRKEPQQDIQIYSVPKFEQLAIDTNADASHPNKTKTPISVRTKLSSINSLPTSYSNENDLSPVSKTFVIKTRSSVIHSTPSVVTDKYELGKKMGDGNFAVVRRSKARDSDREVAIKIIDKSKMQGKQYMLEHEINIMYMCRHPNIIRLFEDYETPEEIYLVMELIKGGDLFEYITRHRCFDEPTSSLMIRDVAEALIYIHAKKIVHRDVKPENLLVMHRKDGRITIKLTDFGLALQITDTIKTVCGTPTYVAPEILAETGYGTEVDCWAIGVILYILLCGYPPFKTVERNQDELFQMIQRGKFSYDTEYWNSISPAVKNLIDHLLIVDRQKRMRADQILLHPWIITTGHSKSILNMEELKKTLRLEYDMKMAEYAMESTTAS